MNEKTEKLILLLAFAGAAILLLRPSSGNTISIGSIATRIGELGSGLLDTPDAPFPTSLDAGGGGGVIPTEKTGCSGGYVYQPGTGYCCGLGQTYYPGSRACVPAF